MGYKAEKEKIEKEQALFKKILVCILLFCILGGCLFSFFVKPESWKYYVALPNVDKRKVGELRIHYLDVGQGDASLIELPDGRVMLIDGGDGSEAATKSVLRYLNALKIKEIDHLIVTHTDSDHCGGLADVLKYKTVFNAYLPPSFPENGTKYAEFYAALVKENCNLFYSSRTTSLLSKDQTMEYPYSVQFLYPYGKMVDDVLAGKLTFSDDNELSAVVWLEYMDVGALFMGDAPQETEEQLLKDDKVGALQSIGVHLQSTELLKLSHHGSKTATSLEFLQYLGVKDGVISCGKDNLYGHPASETLARLTQAQVKAHRTDVNGHIVATISKNGSYKIEYIAT